MTKILVNRANDNRSPAHPLFFPKPESLDSLRTRYDDVEADQRTDVARRFTELVSEIRIGKICKKTAWSRLSGTLESVARNVPDGDRIDFLDVGASDGVATHEATEFLRDRFAERTVATTMVDLYSHLDRCDGTLYSEYRTTTGEPVLLRIGPIGMRIGNEIRTRNPINRMTSWLFLNWQWLRTGLKKRYSISLINPLASNDGQISAVEWDIMKFNSEFVGKFNVIRASNILNPSYFPPERLITAVQNLRQYLSPGGLLVISRNDEDGGEDGTMWREEDSRLREIDKIGQGSLIADLVNESSATTSEQG